MHPAVEFTGSCESSSITGTLRIEEWKIRFASTKVSRRILSEALINRTNEVRNPPLQFTERHVLRSGIDGVLTMTTGNQGYTECTGARIIASWPVSTATSTMTPAII